MNEQEARELGKRLLKEGAAGAGTDAVRALEVAEEARDPSPSRFWAVVLSVLMPGLGLVYAGRRRLAWSVFAVVMASLSLAALGFTGLVVAVLGWFTHLVVVASVRRGEKAAAFDVVLQGAFMSCVWVAVTFGARTWVVEGFTIPSGSMIPTFQVGDHFMVTKWHGAPARGDVIVFVYPKNDRQDFVSRVVAVAGDRVAVKDGAVWLNGEAVPRERIDGECSFEDRDQLGARTIWRTDGCVAFREQLGAHRFQTIEAEHGVGKDFPGAGEDGESEYVVPAGHVFVLGDNRNNSHDSRFWGPVPLANVKGRASYIWYSAGGKGGGVRWERLGQRVE